MPGFASGTITTNAIFYRVGVPNSDTTFGAYTRINYEMLRQAEIYNRMKNGGKRQIYTLFGKQNK